MGTRWMEVISNYAMPLIDDLRLQEEVRTSPAAFYRRMVLYMDVGLTKLNSPPALGAYLTGEMERPGYLDENWVSTAESVDREEIVIETNNPGCDLFSCVIREEDRRGRVTLTPYDGAVYDPETGKVTFPRQDREGIEYEMDFYRDGAFAHDLTERQKGLVGLAIAVIWDERFSRDWLSMAQKPHDQTFPVVNESNYMDKVTARMKANRADFAAELNKYEQDVAYGRTVGRWTHSGLWL